MDETLKTVPTLLRQLYSVHAPAWGNGNFLIVPLVDALMTKKSEELQWPPKLSGHLTKEFSSSYFSKMKEAIGLRVLSCRSPISLVCY